MLRVAGLLSVVCAIAMPAAAAAAPQDFASGGGHIDFGVGAGTVNFTGHGSPANAHGQVHLNIDNTGAFEDLKGRVDCVTVEGNEASLSGAFTRGPSGFPEFRYFVLAVRDNGNPPNATADEVDMLISSEPVPCSIEFFPATSPFAQGNAVVKDRTS